MLREALRRWLVPELVELAPAKHSPRSKPCAPTALTTYATDKGGTGKLKCPVLASIALAAGCSPAVLYMISKGHKRPSPDMAKRISAATEGVVGKHDLRPDIYDAPADAAAA